MAFRCVFPPPSDFVMSRRPPAAPRLPFRSRADRRAAFPPQPPCRVFNRNVLPRRISPVSLRHSIPPSQYLRCISSPWCSLAVSLRGIPPLCTSAVSSLLSLPRCVFLPLCLSSAMSLRCVLSPRCPSVANPSSVALPCLEGVGTN